MKRYILFLFSFLVIGFSEAKAQVADSFFSETTTFLETYVSNGKVAYDVLCKTPEVLNKLLEQAKVSRVTITSPKEYQAFWINAYNLAVIKGVIDNYPIASPLDKKGFFDTTTYELGGKTITLNDIENKMLRAKFNDARFHFVLVCGAKGCPPLISKAYTPDNLESLLLTQTTKALNKKSFIEVSEKKVALSEIFKWYKEDFIRDGKTEIDFINQFRKEEINQDSKISYYSYDWRLNSK